MAGYIGVQPLTQTTQTRQSFTATTNQTSFATSGYTPGFLDVYLNGVKLVENDDYTASNGSDVILTVGATTGDDLSIISYRTFETSNQTFTGITTFEDLVFVTNEINLSDKATIKFNVETNSIEFIVNQ